jgi:C-terminal processing protease CtpA/Prc
MKKLGFKIWLLIILLALSLLSIFVSQNGFTFFQKGVLVTSVEKDSIAFDSGLKQGQRIISVDGTIIESLEDYSNYMQTKFISGEEVKTIIQTTDSEIIYYSNQAPEITISEIPTGLLHGWFARRSPNA